MAAGSRGLQGGAGAGGNPFLHLAISGDGCVAAFQASVDFGAGIGRAYAVAATRERRTWTAVNNGLTPTDIRRVVAHPNVANQGTVYAGSGTNAVFKTVDSGANWASASTGIFWAFRPATLIRLSPTA